MNDQTTTSAAEDVQERTPDQSEHELYEPYTLPATSRAVRALFEGREGSSLKRRGKR